MREFVTGCLAMSTCTCEWCGIRTASLLAKAANPRGRRESLRLCERCWDGRWSHDDYRAEPLHKDASRALVIGRDNPRCRPPSKPEAAPLEAAC